MPAASLTSAAMVYDEPLDKLAMSDAAYVIWQVLDETEQVSVTLLIVVVTVCPSSAPDVVMVMTPLLSSSAAFRCVPHAAETPVTDGCVLSITTFDPPVIAVTAVETAFPAVSVKVHEKPTVPSASPSAIVTAAVWWSVSVTVP